MRRKHCCSKLAKDLLPEPTPHEKLGEHAHFWDVALLLHSVHQVTIMRVFDELPFAAKVSNAALCR